MALDLISVKELFNHPCQDISTNSLGVTVPSPHSIINKLIKIMGI